MKKIVLTLLFVVSILQPQSAPAQKSWSVRIGDSFISLHPDTIVYAEEEKSKRWNYEQGLMLEAYYQLWLHTRDERYRAYIKKNLDHYIRGNGEINTYKQSEFNIDNIAPGKAVLRAYALFREDKYAWAADTLRKQLSLHPRTSEGGFWHKKIYPNQMWLDGLFMAQPFYTLYSVMGGDDTAFTDIARQFILIDRHAKDPKTGLYFHGWDEFKQQQWADPVTGCSPNLWGRSLGWFAMALVDVLDDFPKNHPQRQRLADIFTAMMENVVKVQDKKHFTWYQIVDKPNAEGNYPEASASAMFTYALAKGVNKGYLSSRFQTAAQESFGGLIKHFVTQDAAGHLFLKDVVKVSGLGGNPYRDGSVKYYLSEPKRTNDFKGYGPFLLAAIEIEKMKK